MSEFSCKNNHMMSYKDLVCRICGEPCCYLDGLSDNEWRRIEKMEGGFYEEENRKENYNEEKR